MKTEDVDQIPEDVMQAAREAYHSAFGGSDTASQTDVYEAIAKATLAERERIIARLLEEADLTPCAEDAMVTRSNAFLIKADFSYEEAERLSEETEG